jgi:hypothetical protein
MTRSCPPTPAPLTSGPAGATGYILRDPRQILASAARLLDFGCPVAVMPLAILQHLGDQDDPYTIVATLLAATPQGSYLAQSHPAQDIDAAFMAKMADTLNQMMAEKVTFRDRPAVARFFEGLELAEHGMVQASKWRPASAAEGPARRPCGPASRANPDQRTQPRAITPAHDAADRHPPTRDDPGARLRGRRQQPQKVASTQ